MNDTVSKRASFWRVTLSDLIAFIKAEWQWMIIVAAVFAIGQRLAFVGYDISGIKDQLMQARGDAAKHMEILGASAPSLMYPIVLTILTTIFSCYVFTVLYLRRTMRDNAPAFSVKNFLYWLWIMIQKAAILYLPLALIFVVFAYTAGRTPAESLSGLINMFLIMSSDEGAVFVAQHGFSALGVANLVLLLVGNIWFFYFYFCLFLFYLVSPLAVLRQKPVFKTSAMLTKNDLLRIWWQSIVVLGVLFVVMSPLVLVNIQFIRSFGATSPQAHMITALINGIWESVTGAAMAIYAVVVYRTLLNEQKVL